MTPAELTFRLVLVVLGVVVAGMIAWLWHKAVPGENVGCIMIVLGALAVTLLVGGIGGPDPIRAFWG